MIVAQPLFQPHCGRSECCSQTSPGSAQSATNALRVTVRINASTVEQCNGSGSIPATRVAINNRVFERKEKTKMKEKMVAFWKDEQGLTMVEYAVAGGLVCAGAVLAFQALGLNVERIINIINGHLNTVT
jgi:pilus assembly protein Flp/PilA